MELNVCKNVSNTPKIILFLMIYLQTTHPYILVKNNFRMDQLCSFCSEPNVINCLNKSLHNKYRNEQDKNYKIINEYISKEYSSNFNKYLEILYLIDELQRMGNFLMEDNAKRELKGLIEYYKYRKYVPVFSRSYASEAVYSFYYKKLKYYYNSIKRKLNLSVDKTSSQFSVISNSQTITLVKQSLLKQIKQQKSSQKQEKDEKQFISLSQYKTESKALQQLVSIMKITTFDGVQTLKTEDCFEQQEMFRKTHESKFGKEKPENSIKNHPKSKIFKKIVQGSERKVYEDSLLREKISQKLKNLKHPERKQTEKKPKLIQYRIKEVSSTKLKNKSTKSLTKINSIGKLSSENIYMSSKKKSFSQNNGLYTKSKANVKSFQHLKLPLNTLNKLKDSLRIDGKREEPMNIVKTIPNSPYKTSRKNSIQIQKTDNILTIRKKKFEALRDKIRK